MTQRRAEAITGSEGSPITRLPVNADTTFEVWGFLRLELELNKSPAHRDCDGLSTVVRAKFIHNVLDVNLDGLFRNAQQFGNIPIPISAGDLLQNLYFARRQVVIAQMLGKLGGQLWRHALLSGVNLADCLHAAHWAACSSEGIHAPRPLARAAPLHRPQMS